jgi:hypothetical protein
VDERPHIEYAVTINGEKQSLWARGWYYTHCVAVLEGRAWVVRSWHGAREGEMRHGTTASEMATGDNACRKVLEVGKSYNLPVPFGRKVNP